MRLDLIFRGRGPRSALAACLLAASGCCYGKGFIVRGDWSLEFNHIANIASHGVEYDPSCLDGCASGCGETMVETIDDHTPIDGESSRASPVNRAPRGYDGPAHEEIAPPAPTQGPAYSKFVPVPTRPAFSRAIDHLDGADSAVQPSYDSDDSRDASEMDNGIRRLPSPSADVSPSSYEAQAAPPPPSGESWVFVSSDDTVAEPMQALRAPSTASSTPPAMRRLGWTPANQFQRVPSSKCARHPHSACNCCR